MPQLRTYSIFLSHSWAYSSEYETIISWLKGARLLNLADHSVSKFNPLPTKTNKQLYNELTTKIKRVHIVIIVAGMYYSHRDWMKAELDIAKNNNNVLKHGFLRSKNLYYKRKNQDFVTDFSSPVSFRRYHFLLL